MMRHQQMLGLGDEDVRILKVASRQATMNVSEELLIRGVFRLSGGKAVLACEGSVASDVLTGRRVRLVVDGRVRQSIVLASERKMLNQTGDLNQRAFETLDQVEFFLTSCKADGTGLFWTQT